MYTDVHGFQFQTQSALEIADQILNYHHFEEFDFSKLNIKLKKLKNSEDLKTLRDLAQFLSDDARKRLQEIPLSYKGNPMSYHVVLRVHRNFFTTQQAISEHITKFVESPQNSYFTTDFFVKTAGGIFPQEVSTNCQEMRGEANSQPLYSRTH